MISTDGYLAGSLLAAMPDMRDERFSRTLIYLCAHSEEGAMGLIVNKRAESLTLSDLYSKIGIPIGDMMGRRPVHYGGPVETGRGFVLHSSDYFAEDATMRVDKTTSMTATMDVLQAMAGDEGPREAIVTLGYAGWAPGQLEAELQQNGWLAVEPDRDLLFDAPNDRKWEQALAKLGASPAVIATGGRA